jgi:copper chaperone CopZ
MKTYRIQGLSCTNCAAKFENNVRELEGVKDAKINFGASKISVQGSATIEQIEKAGAFDNLKIRGEQDALSKNVQHAQSEDVGTQPGVGSGSGVHQHPSGRARGSPSRLFRTLLPPGVGFPLDGPAGCHHMSPKTTYGFMYSL